MTGADNSDSIYKPSPALKRLEKLEKKMKKPTRRRKKEVLSAERKVGFNILACSINEAIHNLNIRLTNNDWIVFVEWLQILDLVEEWT